MYEFFNMEVVKKKKQPNFFGQNLEGEKLPKLTTDLFSKSIQISKRRTSDTETDT